MALVQSTRQRAASGANALAYGSNNVAGNLLILSVMMEDDTSTISSVTDSRGNTWAACSAIKHSGGANFSTQLWYAKNSGAGANTVTLTPSAGASNIAIFEYSGYDTTAPFTQHIEASDATGFLTTADSGNVTTANASELLFAVAASNRVLTAGSGYSGREGDVFNLYFLTEDKVAGGAGSYNATETLGTAGSWTINLASFKPAAGGAPALQTRNLLGVGA